MGSAEDAVGRGVVVSVGAAAVARGGPQARRRCSAGLGAGLGRSPAVVRRPGGCSGERPLCQGGQGGQPPREMAGRGSREEGPGLRGCTPGSPFVETVVAGLWRVTAGPGGTSEPRAGFR